MQIGVFVDEIGRRGGGDILNSPIDIISTRTSSRIKRAATDAAKPEHNVASTGVPVKGSTRARSLWKGEPNVLFFGPGLPAAFIPENKPIFGHRVDDPRHGEHGAEHGHGQPSQRTYRHDDFAFERPHLTEHFDQG
jgi:hypothetical protein